MFREVFVSLCVTVGNFSRYLLTITQWYRTFNLCSSLCCFERLFITYELKVADLSCFASNTCHSIFVVVFTTIEFRVFSVYHYNALHSVVIVVHSPPS